MNIMIAGKFLPTREIDGEIALEVTSLVDFLTEESYDSSDIVDVLEEEGYDTDEREFLWDDDNDHIYCTESQIRSIFGNLFDEVYEVELNNLFRNIQNYDGPMLQLNFNGTLLDNLEATMENGSIQISDGLETVSLTPASPVGPFLRYQGLQIPVIFRGQEVLYHAQQFLTALFHYELNEREVHHFIINQASNPPADVEYKDFYYVGHETMIQMMREMNVDRGYLVTAGRIFQDFGTHKVIGQDYNVWGQ